MNTILDEAANAFRTIHETFCLEEDSKKCAKQCQELLNRLEKFKLIDGEDRIRSQIVMELLVARDFMVTTKQPENDKAAMWIKFAFDKAIGFALGDKK